MSKVLFIVFYDKNIANIASYCVIEVDHLIDVLLVSLKLQTIISD